MKRLQFCRIIFPLAPSFSLYTLKATFLNGSCAFQCLNQQVFAPWIFTGTEIKVLITYASQWSKINIKLMLSFCRCRMSSWLIFLLSITSFSSSMFSSDLWQYGSQNLIFFNSFFTPFTFHFYSGWSLTNPVTPCIYSLSEDI